MGDKQTLLKRGWYVLTEVETAFLGLSGRAHDLLILIKHFQGGNPSAYPSQARLAHLLKTSVRTVQRILRELVDKGALVLRRTGRASHHTVRYARSTVAELRALVYGDIPDPAAAAGASDTTDPVAPDATHVGGSIEEEPITKNQEEDIPPSGRGGAAAPQESHKHQQEEEQMGFRQQPQGQRDDMDPATALGLWEAQELPGSPQPTRSRPPRREPTQAQQDAPYGLARYLAGLLSGTDWAGPSPVNRAALARNLKTWKAEGLAAETIRQMMDLYAAGETPRHPSKAPWIDFLARRRALLQQVQQGQQADAMEEHRDDPEYWLGGIPAAA